MLPRLFALLISLLCLVRTDAMPVVIDDLDHVAFEGRVLDASGAALPGAKVTARHAATGQQRSVTTQADGGYRLMKLLPGIYELSVELKDFQTVRIENLAAAAGLIIRRDFNLNPAQLEAQITIDASTSEPLIDTQRTVVGGTITRRQIEDLPTEGRNALDLLFTLPGTSPPALSDRDLAEGDPKDNFRRTPEEVGIFGLNGGTPFSNNLTIEGLDNNDDRAARERFLPSLDSVEEVQVISNQFSAEYGRASGGRVNIRLRGGANKYRGRGFYYFRDESLNANSYTRNRDPERGFRLPYQNRDFGSTFGGPIKKDKVFFFTGYERDYVYDRADIAALVPVASNPAFALPRPNGANLGSTARNQNGQTVPVNGGAAVALYDERVTTPRSLHNLQNRTDFNLGEKHNAFALFTLTRERDERGFPGARRTLETIRRTGRNSYSIAGADNLTLSARAVNAVRFQFSRLTPADAPQTQSPVVLVEIDDPRDIGGDSDSNPLSRTGTLTAGASTISGTDRREDRYQIQDTFSYVRGAHTLRVGGDVQAIRSRFIDLLDTTGTFTFSSPADFLAGKPRRYEHRFNTDSALSNTYAGLFVQDDWRVRRNLVFSFGLRWDNETILRDRNNFGPRLAASWDPFGKGKTVVRAGYGIFYNRALLRTLDDFILTSSTLLVDTNNNAAKPLLDQLRFPAVLPTDDPRVAQTGVKLSGFLRRLSSDFRIPESYQAALGFEHELGKGFKIEVNYVFSRGLHLWRETNVNAPRLPAGFKNFAEYLTSRDFDNRVDPVTGRRPITATGTADTVRFSLSTTPSEVITVGGRRIVVIGLNTPSTVDNALGVAASLAALRNLRADPQVTQAEELQAIGNSFYHGATFEVYRRLTKRALLRGSYTLSKLIDDGVVNTSSALVVGDFGRERARSLLDARHRFAVSGSYQFPRRLSNAKLSGTFNFSSSRPFSIGIGNFGNDRNLDDLPNDRPNFTGDLNAIRSRRPNQRLDPALVAAFSAPTVGTVGNLPRNAGHGPRTYTMNLRLAREFRLRERRSAEFQIEAFNPLNATVLSFGSQFVNFVPTSLGNFLVPPRAVRPRTLRIGVKFDF